MGVTFLLDTHVVLWLRGDPTRVHPELRDVLGDPRNRLLVSAASAMEVATKTRLGKLEIGRSLMPTWTAWLRETAAEELAISGEHALLAGSMPWEHRDPFDRLLVAQALVEGVPLVSSDAAIRAVPGLRTVDPTTGR
ncbi:type II toxin-antitoxin system VapC family toxin [Cellulomonas marina]|uniref:PIN domain nuclease, a component of toxin-antitoxin system (PIN domain) n=1 Tax=Cellulomonas marina TaxID=988821 RepID=A0A1I1AGC5_9CELL|nr:type II toxin-antitoxin system VapC family toxin [Cellulomonas marina]GIG30203.1 twitching motility protein PilT [Cellulomonas marina]SFB37007.1 PIN domain nuclease, a component of toxin-antitoxin system (PIN domain) [Cellulomonas marina]